MRLPCPRRAAITSKQAENPQRRRLPGTSQGEAMRFSHPRRPLPHGDDSTSVRRHKSGEDGNEHPMDVSLRVKPRPHHPAFDCRNNPLGSPRTNRVARYINTTLKTALRVICESRGNKFCPRLLPCHLVCLAT